MWVLLSVSNSAHVTILFFFCTPVHSSAQGMIAGTDNKPFRTSQHFPSPGERTRPRLPGFVTASVFSTLPCLCANLFMGCRGFWKVKDFCHSPAPGSSDARDTRSNAAQSIVTRTRQGRHGRALFKGRGWSDASPAYQGGGTVHLPGMLRGRVMSCPKKSMHTWDKRQLR